MQTNKTGLRTALMRKETLMTNLKPKYRVLNCALLTLFCGVAIISCGGGTSSSASSTPLPATAGILGESSFSGPLAAGGKIAIGGANTPYIAYFQPVLESQTGLRLATLGKVQSYSGSWHNVGGPFSNTIGQGGLAIAVQTIANTQVPYIAYSDSSKGNALTVKMYSNGSWTTVGNPNSVDSVSAAASNINIGFDTNNKLYVGYEYGGISGHPEVISYNSSNNTWTKLGGTNVQNTPVSNFNMHIASDNIISVAYSGIVKPTVLQMKQYKINDSSPQWINVATATVPAPFLAMTSAPGGFELAIYKDTLNGGGAAQYYNGKTTGFQAPLPDFADVNVGNTPALALNSNLVPYVAYSNPDRTVVLKSYNQQTNTWQLAGQSIAQVAVGPQIAIDSSNNVYVLYASILQNNQGNLSVYKYIP